MSNDYLWDRSGPPDPEVERLEKMLGRLRTTPPVPDISATYVGPGLSRAARTAGATHLYIGVRFLAPALATAAAIAMMVGITWQAARRIPWSRNVSRSKAAT